MYLVVNSFPTVAGHYVEYPGLKLIKNIDLEIGGQRIKRSVRNSTCPHPVLCRGGGNHMGTQPRTPKVLVRAQCRPRNIAKLIGNTLKPRIPKHVPKGPAG